MPHRVLIVDTDSEALAGDRSILVDAGYVVTWTADFTEAKEQLRLAPPDLLMTDVRLGAYNGLHLVHRLHFDHPEMPAIVTDKAADPVLQEEARRADALYLIKPVDPTTLVDTIRALLARRPSRRGMQAARRWSRKSPQVRAAGHDVSRAWLDPVRVV